MCFARKKGYYFDAMMFFILHCLLISLFLWQAIIGGKYINNINAELFQCLIQHPWEKVKGKNPGGQNKLASV